MFPATPWDLATAQPPLPSGPRVNPSRAAYSRLQVSVFSCGEEWEGRLIMAWSPGPDCHPNSMGREWGWAAHRFPFSVTNETRWRGARTLQGRGRGSGPAPLPLLFSASSQATPSSSCWHIPWVGGRGRRAQGPEAPAPPHHAGVPPLNCPQRLGEGGCNSRPAPPYPLRCGKPRGAPLPSQGDPDPGGDHPHPTKNGGRGGQTYGDVRDALLALVRHGPSGALSPRVDQGAAFRSAGLSLGPAPRGRGDKAQEE